MFVSKRTGLESGSSTSRMAASELLRCGLERERWRGSRREAVLSVAIASVLVSSAGDALAEGDCSFFVCRRMQAQNGHVSLC